VGRGEGLSRGHGRRVGWRRLSDCCHHVEDDAINDDKLQREKQKERLLWRVLVAGMKRAVDRMKIILP